MDTAPRTVKSDWLLKRGGSVKNWKRRYCVLLDNGTLRYFSSDQPNNSNLKGEISLRDACVEPPADLDGIPTDKGAPFCIITPGRVFIFLADDEDAVTDWAAAIDDTIGNLQEDTTSGPAASNVFAIPAADADAFFATLADGGPRPASDVSFAPSARSGTSRVSTVRTPRSELSSISTPAQEATRQFYSKLLEHRRDLAVGHALSVSGASAFSDDESSDSAEGEASGGPSTDADSDAGSDTADRLADLDDDADAPDTPDAPDKDDKDGATAGNKKKAVVPSGPIAFTPTSHLASPSDIAAAAAATSVPVDKVVVIYAGKAVLSAASALASSSSTGRQAGRLFLTKRHAAFVAAGKGDATADHVDWEEVRAVDPATGGFSLSLDTRTLTFTGPTVRKDGCLMLARDLWMLAQGEEPPSLKLRPPRPTRAALASAPLAGKVFKLRASNSGWRSRYAIVHRGCLVLFYKPGDLLPATVIALADCMAASADQLTRHSRTFGLFFISGRSFFLRAGLRGPNVKTWIATINEVRDPVPPRSLAMLDAISRSGSLEAILHTRELYNAFPSLSDTDQLIACFPASLQKGLPVGGTLFFTVESLCFAGKLLSAQEKLIIPYENIVDVQLSTVFGFPAVLVVTLEHKYHFKCAQNQPAIVRLLLDLWAIGTGDGPPSLSEDPPAPTAGALAVLGPEHQGWLIKLGQKPETRWCVLFGNTLYYYVGPEGLKPQGSIILSGCMCIDGHDLTGHRNTLALLFSATRSYFFRTSSADDAKEWIGAVNASVPRETLPPKVRQALLDVALSDSMTTVTDYRAVLEAFALPSDDCPVYLRNVTVTSRRMPSPGALLVTKRQLLFAASNRLLGSNFGLPLSSISKVQRTATLITVTGGLRSVTFSSNPAHAVNTEIVLRDAAALAAGTQPPSLREAATASAIALAQPDYCGWLERMPASFLMLSALGGIGSPRWPRVWAVLVSGRFYLYESRTAVRPLVSVPLVECVAVSSDKMLNDPAAAVEERGGGGGSAEDAEEGEGDDDAGKDKKGISAVVGPRAPVKNSFVLLFLNSESFFLRSPHSAVTQQWLARINTAVPTMPRAVWDGLSQLVRTADVRDIALTQELFSLFSIPGSERIAYFATCTVMDGLHPRRGSFFITDSYACFASRSITGLPALRRCVPLAVVSDVTAPKSSKDIRLTFAPDPQEASLCLSGRELAARELTKDIAPTGAKAAPPLPDEPEAQEAKLVLRYFASRGNAAVVMNDAWASARGLTPPSEEDPMTMSAFAARRGAARDGTLLVMLAAAEANGPAALVELASGAGVFGSVMGAGKNVLSFATDLATGAVSTVGGLLGSKVGGLLTQTVTGIADTLNNTLSAISSLSAGMFTSRYVVVRQEWLLVYRDRYAASPFHAFRLVACESLSAASLGVDAEAFGVFDAHGDFLILKAAGGHHDRRAWVDAIDESISPPPSVAERSKIKELVSKGPQALERQRDFFRLFDGFIPDNEKMLATFNCAYQHAGVLSVQGRLYVTQHYLLWATTIPVINLKEVCSIADLNRPDSGVFVDGAAFARHVSSLTAARLERELLEGRITQDEYEKQIAKLRSDGFSMNALLGEPLVLTGRRLPYEQRALVKATATPGKKSDSGLSILGRVVSGGGNKAGQVVCDGRGVVSNSADDLWLDSDGESTSDDPEAVPKAERLAQRDELRKAALAPFTMTLTNWAVNSREAAYALIEDMRAIDRGTLPPSAHTDTPSVVVFADPDFGCPVSVLDASKGSPTWVDAYALVKYRMLFVFAGSHAPGSAEAGEDKAVGGGLQAAGLGAAKALTSGLISTLTLFEAKRPILHRRDLIQAVTADASTVTAVPNSLAVVAVELPPNGEPEIQLVGAPSSLLNNPTADHNTRPAAAPVFLRFGEPRTSTAFQTVASTCSGTAISLINAERLGTAAKSATASATEQDAATLWQQLLTGVTGSGAAPDPWAHPGTAWLPIEREQDLGGLVTSYRCSLHVSELQRPLQGALVMSRLYVGFLGRAMLAEVRVLRRWEDVTLVTDSGVQGSSNHSLVVSARPLNEPERAVVPCAKMEDLPPPSSPAIDAEAALPVAPVDAATASLAVPGAPSSKAGAFGKLGRGIASIGGAVGGAVVGVGGAVVGGVVSGVNTVGGAVGAVGGAVGGVAGAGVSALAKGISSAATSVTRKSSVQLVCLSKTDSVSFLGLGSRLIDALAVMRDLQALAHAQPPPSLVAGHPTSVAVVPDRSGYLLRARVREGSLEWARVYVVLYRQRVYWFSDLGSASCLGWCHIGEAEVRSARVDASGREHAGAADVDEAAAESGTSQTQRKLRTCVRLRFTRLRATEAGNSPIAGPDATVEETLLLGADDEARVLQWYRALEKAHRNHAAPVEVARHFKALDSADEQTAGAVSVVSLRKLGVRFAGRAGRGYLRPVGALILLKSLADGRPILQLRTWNNKPIVTFFVSRLVDVDVEMPSRSSSDPARITLAYRATAAQIARQEEEDRLRQKGKSKKHVRFADEASSPAVVPATAPTAPGPEDEDDPDAAPAEVATHYLELTCADFDELKVWQKLLAELMW
jgi:hypothetical protein